MARAWEVQCVLWKGIDNASGEEVLCTAPVLRLASWVSGPGKSSTIPSIRNEAAASCKRCARCNNHDVGSAACSEGDKHGSQDRLWSQDNTRWWGNGHRKRNSRPLDLRHMDCREPLWFPNSHNPTSLDAQLANLDAGMKCIASAASPWGLLVDPADQLVSLGYEEQATPQSVKRLCQERKLKEAVEALEVLVGTNSGISKHLFYHVLKGCVAQKDLMLGGRVHALALKSGFGSDTFLCNHLVRMYASHGKLQTAMNVFEGVAVPDGFMWFSIISAQVKQGQPERGIELYQQMRALTTELDGYVLVAALQACAAAGDLQSGKQVHDDALNSRAELNMYTCSSLVDMYAKCGSLKDARRVFDRLVEKNVVVWNALIAGYAREKGMSQECLKLYSAMQNEGTVVPDATTFSLLLQACANVGTSALEMGKQLHSQLKYRRLDLDVVVGGSLVNMYVKCGKLKDARTVFDGLSERNVVTWTSMIAGYAQQEGMGQAALDIYKGMRQEGISVPNAVTFVCLLQAVASVGAPALEQGQQLHSQLKDCGLASDVDVGGSLVNMYAKCGSLKDARIVFDGLSEKNVVTWTSMIAGYAQQEGMGHKALDIYGAMRNQGTVVPNVVTFVCLLRAVASVGAPALEQGHELHSQLRDCGLASDVVVGGSLINMYTKCGNLKDARIVFDGLGNKNVVTWNAMISGYAHGGFGQKALELHAMMQQQDTTPPDRVTYACLLEACASVGALQQGRQLHSEIRACGYESDEFIGTCLVKMYAKCGRLEVSREVFDRLASKSLVTWNVLLKGYAEQGEAAKAIQCFQELVKQGKQPDRVTYTCLLTACSHAGLVDQGQQYLETMLHQHGVEPDDQHYSCMVDLLGRSGHLDEAEQLVRASRGGGDSVSWTALLSACKSYGDAERGRRCFDHLVEQEPTEATPYLLLGSIHANAGNWDEVDRIESLRRTAGARKVPARACIEVKEEVHEFSVGEERSDIAATLRKMKKRVQEGGHVPQTQLVLRADVSVQGREEALCGHAEKLALAYGLLNTPAGSTLVVTKNLRMCNDCHSSTKIISRLEKRDIVVRDGHRVHRFQNGACSCQDRP